MFFQCAKIRQSPNFLKTKKKTFICTKLHKHSRNTFTFIKMHIAITGNIGAGKTTLAKMLADHYGWEVLFEAVEGNPYLKSFYEDMPRWSFNLQIYFLNSRFEQVQKIRKMHYKTVVQDRTIYEDAFIFARNLHDSGLMSDQDYDSYFLLFQTITNAVPPPDLTIYLQADVPKLVSQIKKRGRDFEMNMDQSYLQNLNVLYEDFAQHYDHGKIVTINVNDLDYAANEADFQKIISILNPEFGYK